MINYHMSFVTQNVKSYLRNILTKCDLIKTWSAMAMIGSDGHDIERWWVCGVMIMIMWLVPVEPWLTDILIVWSTDWLMISFLTSMWIHDHVDPWSLIDRLIDWLIDWLKLCSSFHYFSFFHSFLFLFSFLIRMIIYPHVLHWFDISSKFNGGSLFIPWNGKGLLNFVLRFFKVHYFSGNFNGYVNFFWNF